MRNFSLNYKRKNLYPTGPNLGATKLADTLLINEAAHVAESPSRERENRRSCGKWSETNSQDILADLLSVETVSLGSKTCLMY